MNERLSNQTSVVLFADPPALDDLCVISVCVKKILQTVPSTSRFQIQTIKCREIIFTEPDVIASPSFELESIFHVVLQQALFKTGRLQTRFQKLGLEISKPSLVTPAQYQSCLRYTLLAKLAPNWNKAGQWLIQGRDFLTQAGYANAIKMDLTVTNGELFFTIDASTVRFPSLTIEDLDVPAPCYNKFLHNKSAIIHQHSIPMVWCHILPSMKKGTIVNITHELPDDGPFRSYKELKRHWKNHYGYRLPEEEDDMIYYQIHFRPLGERLFTYPEPCLRARDIQRVPRVDPKPILISFLQDLQKKMPRICGFPLKLHSKACYPTIDLTEVTKVEKRPVQNLSTKIPQKKIIYRNNDDIQKLISKVPECHTSKQDHTLPVSSDGNKQASLKATQLPNNVYLTQNSYAAADVQSHISKFHEHCQEKNYDTSSYIHESTSTDKLGIHLQEPSLFAGTDIDKSSTCLEGKHHKTVPVFKTVVRRASHYEQSSTQPQSQKLVPIFRPKTFKPSTVPSSQNEAHNRQHTVVDHTDNYVSDVNCDKNRKHVGIPSFHAKKTTKEHSSKGNVKQPLKRVENLNLNTKAAPKMCSNSGSKKNQTLGLSVSKKPFGTAVNLSPSNMRNVNVHDQSPSRNTLIMQSSSNENRLSSSAKSYSFQRPMGTVPATPKSHTHVPVTPKSYTPLHTTPKANMLLVGGLSSTPCTPAMKRPCPSSNESTPAMKKPRPKQQVQDIDVEIMARSNQSSNESTPAMKKPRPKQQVQDIDVEIMARSNQLNKVNTVTLISWLKERGITCKAKDKKGDLVEKALKLLNLSVPEQ
ncbi:uncharacterized protein C18orf63-like [Mytilus californianus]|uniref:uncharacterized protein C18orf63-like n=1 Tax=Mytilus californianus TaxID=6549 RepID=UPI0022451E45|nr:uncharacterized protein C18orf63-like [Mytilus californianus]